MKLSRSFRAIVLTDALVSLLMIPLIRAVYEMVRGLPRVATREPVADQPCVSILVPARDEELAIGGCVGSLLAQRYPRFEVLVLNDRSSDGTAGILAALAQRDKRLRVFDGVERPPRWVGKCWAVHQIAERATGEWLLIVDADTAHHPLMLASTVGFAIEHQLDLLTLGPRQVLASFWERLLLPAIFGVIIFAGGSFRDVNDPRRPVAKANGQFLLFRAESYRRIGGHLTVHDEIVEDFALARRIKGTGHKLMIADGSNLVATRMYRQLGEIWEGFSKNTYFEARRHPVGLLAGLFVPWLLALFPPAVLVWLALRRWRNGGRSLPERVLAVQAALQSGVLLGFSLQLIRTLRLPLYWAGAVPVGLVIFSLIILNSTRRVLSGKGVTWKGRSYGRNEIT